jgi:hypothetical protein
MYTSLRLLILSLALLMPGIVRAQQATGGEDVVRDSEGD